MTAALVHPRVAELMDYLESSRAVLMEAVATVPESRRDERVREDEWSAGEVLDHLALVEGGVARLVERRAERARAEGIGPDPETSSLLSALDGTGLDSRVPRIEAPEMVRPRAGATAAASLRALAETRAALRAAVERAAGLDLSKLSARHPVLGELDLYRWLLMVGKHERRHALQLESLGASLSSR